MLDRSDPVSPVPVRTIETIWDAGESPRPLNNIVVHGEYLHTSDGSFHWPTGNTATTHVQMQGDGVVWGDVLYAVESNGFRVYDLSIPDSPTATGDYPLPFTPSTVVQGEGHLYVPAGSYLHVYDLAQPLAPQGVTGNALRYSRINAGAVAGGWLYLAGFNGLLVYDLSLPDQPILRAELTLYECQDVAISGSTALGSIKPVIKSVRVEVEAGVVIA